MSYESFKNKETWLLNVWGYIDEIANEWIETEKPTGAKPMSISADYCLESFTWMVEHTLKKLPNGIIADFVNDSISTIDWREVAESVKDIVREQENDS